MTTTIRGAPPPLPPSNGTVTAVLGPTNTGKTHYALERMLAHRTGVIGLPLRLLAREVYDRIVALRGPSRVALVTGEERIVPARPDWWVATVEAMPEVAPDFLAIDEIQLCADPERGHVFTDRLLHARGRLETLFLGAETMRPAIAALVPRVQFLARERFSALTWTGARKISRMPHRSAIVGFSVDDVYTIAELLRRQKGGAAVVMGALSPRTRNAQVALYQSGEVDHLVATDAIGMGLNLDIDHVAFSSTVKFDGRRLRHLRAEELGQIAGRAGRYLRSGTFGVTGEAAPIDPETVAAIEQSRFLPVRRLVWRNTALEFGSIERLIASLEAPPDARFLSWLGRARDADDVLALKALASLPEVRARATRPEGVRRLWEVCRIPDYRGISAGSHATLLARVFGFLAEAGRIPEGWFAEQVGRLDRTDGEIDTLSRRLAFIRTWTYVAQRGWVGDDAHWRDETRAVEDRLSDALHARLTQRFVDRRTSVLLRRLKDREGLLAEVNDKGEVTVEGEFVGRLEGFRFRIDRTGSPEEARTLRRAAEEALRPHLHLQADRCYNAPDTEFDFTEQGGLMWGEIALGKLVRGADPLSPGVEIFVDEEAGADVAEKVRRRLGHFIDRRIATLFEPLVALGKDEALTGLARGVAFRLVEAFGILPREEVAADIRALDQEARGVLRKHGIRFGQYTIFLPLLLKPAPTRLRLVLWGLASGLEVFPESPPPGLVTIPDVEGAPEGSYTMSGYRRAGARAIRIDMLERLADRLRTEDSRAGFEATPEMLSITGMTLEQFADLLRGLGYAAEKGERPKVRAPARPQGETTAEDILAAAEARAAAESAGPVAAGDAPVGDAAPGVEPVAETGPAAGPAAGIARAAAAEPAGGAEPAAVAEPFGEAEPAAAAEPAGEAAAAGGEPVETVESVSAVEPAAGNAAPGEPAAPGAPETGSEDAPPAVAGGESGDTAEDAAGAVPTGEVETYYTFTWKPRSRGRGPRPERQGRAAPAGDAEGGQAEGRGRARHRPPRRPDAPAAADGAEGADKSAARAGKRPQHGRRNDQGGARKGDGPREHKREHKHGAKPRRDERQERARVFEARPPRAEKPVDPDNPFAVLAALKDKI